MVNESTIKTIIVKRKKDLDSLEFERYLKEANKLFGTKFKVEDFA